VRCGAEREKIRGNRVFALCFEFIGLEKTSFNYKNFLYKTLLLRFPLCYNGRKKWKKRTNVKEQYV